MRNLAVWLFMPATLLWSLPIQGAAENSRKINQETFYVSMHPHFIVNLAGNAPNRIMQLKAQVLVNDRGTQAAVKTHMPAIRHAMIMMLSDLHPSDVQTLEQKEELSQASLDIIRHTLEKYKATANVEGFFVSSLIIQ